MPRRTRDADAAAVAADVAVEGAGRPAGEAEQRAVAKVSKENGLRDAWSGGSTLREAHEARGRFGVL